ncbi:MAG: DUF4062 domain-containing protein [Desulfobacula sp.]|nr:DUF4062 domain-containing protein [Desulfobacula sp.]
MDWQVESGVRNSVFISATTSDLGNYRRSISDILLIGGIFPVVQDYFGSDHRTIENILLDKIQAADAVICIIGHVFGAYPHSDNSIPERSYTQIEFDFAERYSKPIYLFVADENIKIDHQVDEPDELILKQKKHRENIFNGAKKYESFSSMDELEKKIRGLIEPIKAVSRQRSFKYIDNPPKPLFFVGRTDEIVQLNSAINKSSPAVIVLLGMGGQGKTTLVAHTIRNRKTLPFSAGIWVSAERSNMTFSEFLDCALGEFMGNRFNKSDLPRLESRLRQLIILMQKKPTLIVIDAMERWLTGWGENKEVSGFHDFSLRKGNCDELDEFLKQVSSLNNGSHVIITSRALPAALDMVSCAILPVFPESDNNIGLNSLNEEEAVELLKKFGIVAPDEKLRNLAKQLVCHPLTLTGFACVANKLGKNWESLLKKEDNDPSKVFHNLIDEIRTHLPNKEISESVLKYASLLSEGASLDILKTLIEKYSFPKLNKYGKDFNMLILVITLADWNLLIWDTDTEEVRLHSLVSDYFSKLIPEERKSEIHKEVAIWYESSTEEKKSISLNTKSLALNHYLLAGEGKLAFDCMFNEVNNKSLFDILISQGHLWECAEYLHEISNNVFSIDKVHCILARTQILNDLELSHHALSDLELAIAIILMNPNLNWPPTQILLAKCYGFMGVINNETGKASTAISLFNKSLSIFDSFNMLQKENTSDVIITLANRGAAKYATGEWNEALEDYQKIIDINLMRGSFLQEKSDISIPINEMRFRIANIKLNMGEISSNIQKMEAIINKMRNVQVNSLKRPGKKYLLSLVSLASAYLLDNKPQNTLTILKEIIAPTEEYINQGIWEYSGILGQAYINQARALIRLNNYNEALFASNRSVYFYKDIINRDAKQLEGQLANALFVRAEANFLTGDEENTSQDLKHAISISKIWLSEWYGECNIQTVFLENSIYTLSYLSIKFVNITKELLILIRQCIDRLESHSHKNMAKLKEWGIITEARDLLNTKAKETGVNWTEINI